MAAVDAREGPLEAGRGRARPHRLLRLGRGGTSWQIGIAATAVVAAVAAVWITLEADFLSHPGWLAAQKADFILGPVLIGLYWVRRRPESRFGPLLIGFGLLNVGYVLHSSSEPWLFSAGLLWENVIGLAIYVLILAFPTGRLHGLAARLILLFALVAAVVPAVVILLLLPQVGAGGSISGCRASCPENMLAITSQPSLALDIWETFRYAVILTAVATAGLLIRRLVMGTPPQRRALAIGAAVALVFLLSQVAFHVVALVAPGASELQEIIAWAFAAARAAIWYGFLAGLIAAQLFAARALHRLVGQSLQRPSRGELETMLREPLGDPALRLVFRDPRTGSWSGAAAGDLADDPPRPAGGRDVTLVERGREPAVAIIHDAALDDDPELLRAAGAVALLAAENAELDSDWHKAVQELRRSRARIVRAGEDERRKLERNLHDGVQQRLIATRIELELASRDVSEAQVRSRLDGIAQSLDEALDDVRDVAHGLYPPVLSAAGLVTALEQVQPRAPLRISATGVGRYPPDVESAVYYCCLEAVQNAAKHAGPAASVSIELSEDAGVLRFEVSDDGAGFDPSEPRSGTGLQNMQDRIGALDGRLSIVAASGRGTRVAGAIPLGDAETPRGPR